MIATFSEKMRATPKSVVFFALLLGVPLVVTLVWGLDGIDDTAYTAFYAVEAFMRGYDPSRSAILEQLDSTSPGWTAFLAIAAGLHLPLPQASLIVGFLGWGLACVLMAATGQKLRMRAGGIAAAILLASSPSMVAPTVLATEIPWLLCLAWYAIWCGVHGYWRFQTVALALLLTLHATPAILAVVLLLLWARRCAGAALPWGERLLISGVLALWVLLLSLGIASIPLGLEHAAVWFERTRDLLAESAFYWFGIPLVVAGLILWMRETPSRGAILVSGLAFLLSAPDTDGALAYSLVLFLVGAGIEAMGRWAAKVKLLRLPREAHIWVVGLLAMLPLIVAQAMSLAQARSIHPDDHHALLQEAAEWVCDNTAADDRLLASSQVGYMAKRSTLLFEGKVRDTGGFSALVENLRVDPPDACISYRSLAWDDLQRTGWFQNTYYEAVEFSTDYDVLSPIKVWVRRPTAFDLGPYEPLSVRLPDDSAWIGYTYTPDRITPGQAVSVTLYTHVPFSEVASSGEAGRAAIYLQSLSEGTTYEGQDVSTGRSLVIDNPEIGLVWAETYLVKTPSDLPLGAYYLSASLLSTGSGTRVQLYQDENAFPIDRVTLGYVVVPWRGDLTEAIPVGAMLGAGEAAEHRFALLGYEVEGESVPGGTIDVTLYWEALGDMGAVTTPHFVFVHLLDGSGQLVTQHDGAPAGGAYPLAAWIPGEPVSDSHTLYLDPALASSTYTLQVGVYTWLDFERLPAWDASGNRLQDDVIPLGSITIR